jgi:hypothetical protein
MEVPDTWIPVLNALGIGDVEAVLSIRDQLHVPVTGKKCFISSGIRVVLRLMRYNVSEFRDAAGTHISHLGLKTHVQSILSIIDTLTGDDTSGVKNKMRINVVRENLARAGMVLPDHSPPKSEIKDRKCTYCKAPGATIRVTSSNSCSYFCDRFCMHVSQGCSLIVYYTIPGRLRPRDKLWFIDLPLRMYNEFYNRDVDEATFVESVANMIRSSRATSIADALFLGYYMASRAVCKDFIPHDVYMTGHADQHRIRHNVNGNVFRVPSCNRDDRVTSLIVKGSRNLANWRVIDPGDVDKIKASFVGMRGRIDSGASTTVAAAACYHIITNVIHKKVPASTVAHVFGISTCRVLSSKISSRIRKIILNTMNVS